MRRGGGVGWHGGRHLSPHGSEFRRRLQVRPPLAAAPVAPRPLARPLAAAPPPRAPSLGFALPWPLRAPRLRSEMPAPQLISWHAQRQWLAVGHAAADAALIYDLDAAPSPSVPDCVEEASLVLTHELQSGLSSLAWRPVHCTMLAAGCRGGVVLWALGRQPAGGAGFQRAAGGGNGGGNGSPVGGAAWATFLRYQDGCRCAVFTPRHRRRVRLIAPAAGPSLPGCRCPPGLRRSSLSPVASREGAPLPARLPAHLRNPPADRGPRARPAPPPAPPA